jgi:hypothetical protein
MKQLSPSPDAVERSDSTYMKLNSLQIYSRMVSAEDDYPDATREQLQPPEVAPAAAQQMQLQPPESLLHSRCSCSPEAVPVAAQQVQLPVSVPADKAEAAGLNMPEALIKPDGAADGADKVPSLESRRQYFVTAGILTTLALSAGVILLTDASPVVYWSALLAAILTTYAPRACLHFVSPCGSRASAVQALSHLQFRPCR